MAGEGDDTDVTLGHLKARLEAQQRAAEHPGTPAHPSTSPLDDTRGQCEPLINRISNNWRYDKTDETQKIGGQGDDEREYTCCDLDEDTSCPNTIRDLIASRRLRRMLAVLLLTVVAVYYLWAHYLQPVMAVDRLYEEGFMEQSNGSYGIARGGHDKDLVHLKKLEPHLLPGGEADRDGKRRLVFIGDIHGCKKELLKLLRKVEFNEDTDHLVLVGDTVTKGPENLGVLDELIRLNATSVRGNHEDRLLHIAKKLRLDGSIPVEAESSKGYARDAALVRQLEPRHFVYMRQMPLMLQIPALPMARHPTRKTNSPITEHIIVVHAGLVPGVRLQKQDPYFVMNMRSINGRTHVPSALRDGKNAKPWYDIWCWYNDRIFRRHSMAGFPTDDPESEDEQGEDTPSWAVGLWKNFFGRSKVHPRPRVVIYGHDSKSGLVIHRWSKGLDSGCVSGGKLTALVLNAKGEQELFHVKCKNYRD